jgi:4-hydroxy-3-methylbut-2-enyl diphosphate reductase LytB-like protein
LAGSKKNLPPYFALQSQWKTNPIKTMKKILATLMKVILARHSGAHGALEYAEQSAQGQGTRLSQIGYNPIAKQEFAPFGAIKSPPDALSARTGPVMIAAHGASDRPIPGWRKTGEATVNRAYPSRRADEVLPESDEPGGHMTAIGKGDQEALRALLSEVDAVVVVGGNNKNTERVLSSCRKAGTPSFHIERIEELSPGWFKSFETVGVIAGTSTWREAMEAARIWLRAMIGRKR